jgi:translation initiation factor eIF-2B subunit delta
MSSSDPPEVTEPPKSDPPAATQPPTSANGSAANIGKPQDAAASAGAPKLSGAELKKQAKAEKAARRAQAAQERQGGAVASPSTPGPGQNSEGLKVPKGPLHKRTGSTSGDARNLPFRGGGQRAAPPAPEVPKEEDKTVEFFRHLYKSRTTTVAGAGKEIHPAVLALGMQMSNYTICGSCARLVATLQAFKKVSAVTFESHLVQLYPS